jgi:hypothetical protein
LREEVRAGSFRGNYMLNLKEQMRMRCLRESGVDRRLRVLMVGASQMGRVGDELQRMHGEKVRLVGRMRMCEEHTADHHMEVLEEVALRRDEVDVVIVGGPTNSLVRHGKEGERGFGGERQVRVVKNSDGEDEWTVTYHMTDPVRITMTEKADLVEGMVELIGEIKRTVGDDVRVLHATMFPRFVERCCNDHMTDEDVWLFDGIRRDVNREVKEGLSEGGVGVETVDWWTMVGARNEMTVNEIKRFGMVDIDNVHLTRKMNRSAASALMHRLMETRPREDIKRRRLE